MKYTVSSCKNVPSINLKRSSHLGDLGVDAETILKRMLRKQYHVVGRINLNQGSELPSCKNRVPYYL